MSTVNPNIDNDPFPVFTPRSAMMNRGQSNPPPQTSLQQPFMTPSAIPQSPFSSQQAPRFNTNSSGTNLMRSPSTTQSSTNKSTSSTQQFVLQNMVQNLNLNSTKLTSSTPPPGSMSTVPTPSTSLPHHSTSSHAHRKLFPPSNSTGASPHHHQHHQMHAHHHQVHHSAPHHMPPPPVPVQVPSSQSNVPVVTPVNAGGVMTPIEHLDPSGVVLSDDGTLNRVAPPDLSSIVHLKRSDSYFMSDELRSEIMRKNMMTIAPAPNQDIAMMLPQIVKDYTNLVPLDNQQLNLEHKSRTFGYQTINYKATHVKTNCVYYLKRILGFRLTNQRVSEIVDIWKKIQNANIITLRDVFATKEFNGEHSLVFVYDYFPGLETLQYRLYNNPNFNLKGWANPYNLDGSARPYSAGKGKITLNGSRSLGLLPEQTIWDYVIQLTAIIRAIHLSNLACRILTPSRLLVDHKSRLRLSGVGIFDVIDYENSVASVAAHQQEDLVDLGRIILALACNSLVAIQKEHFNTSIDIMSRTYSADLRNLILHFLTPQSMMNDRVKSINDAMPIIGARFYTCLDNAFTRGDIIENELSKEIENGRLFRLITKLNIVLERQDINGDLSWSETGDRYMLKLFRDYVFHQVNANGAPWIDLSHIVQCLNKFDCGSPDKICLVSPDGQNIMIVTYAQLKKCFEKVFNELTAMMNV